MAIWEIGLFVYEVGFTSGRHHGSPKNTQAQSGFSCRQLCSIINAAFRVRPNKIHCGGRFQSRRIEYADIPFSAASGSSLLSGCLTIGTNRVGIEFCLNTAGAVMPLPPNPKRNALLFL
jgi:hypothetical protein